MIFNEKTLDQFLKEIKPIYNEISKIQPYVMLRSDWCVITDKHSAVISLRTSDETFKKLANDFGVRYNEVPDSQTKLKQLVKADFKINDFIRVFNIPVGPETKNITADQIDQIIEINETLSEYTEYFNYMETKISMGNNRIIIDFDLFDDIYDKDDIVELIIILENYFNEAYNSKSIDKIIDGVLYKVSINGLDESIEKLEY